MSLSYTVREGLAGFGRAKFAAATAVSALVVALVLMGLFSLLAWQGERVANELRQQVAEVLVFLDLDADTGATQLVRNRLEAHPAVQELVYVSKQDALTVFQQEFGEGAGDLAEASFLPASYRVRLKPGYVNADSIVAFSQALGALRPVDEVIYEAELLGQVQQNLGMIQAVGFGFGLLVVLAALFLVGNTIRLTIYARRALIRTMKLVGATNSFIRQPFLVEGVVQGLVGGFLAAVLVSAGYGALLANMPTLTGWPLGAPVVTFLLIWLAGGVLGWLASLVAVRRFIKGVRLS